ncbi:hypothetical protein RAS1_14280 [Phycisphaerae bacterium RAS1]|nr:hypothetical protein RAS1_14280 [Phycisphaerae bacterium RAS1]
MNLHAALDLHRDTLRGLSTKVTYGRGTARVIVTAFRDATRSAEGDESGGVVSVRTDDWIVDRADLVLEGALIEPRAGDVIREAVDGGVNVYEVVAIAGQPPARPSGNDPRRLRIHTQWIATEAPS